MPKKSTKPEDMTTLAGGVEITVTHLTAAALDPALLAPKENDKPEGRLAKFQPLLGTTERVKVRQVPLPLIPPYANAIIFHDEATAIEIYCGKDPGWAETLSLESVNAVADKGLEINLDFLGAWLKRQAKTKEIQTPQPIIDLQTKLATLEKTIRDSLSRTSSTPISDTTG